MSIRFSAIQFLKFEKRCPLVITERSPRANYTGLPDVLGVTDARFLLEIEIKTSMSDFRANAKKEHMRNRCHPSDEISMPYKINAPRQFWFCVPEKIADKVLPEVPEWAGLLVHGRTCRFHINCLKKAPVNSHSQKLTLKQCVRLLRCVGNDIYSLYQAKAHMIAAGHHIDPHANDKFYSEKLVWTGARHEWVPNHDYLNFQI